MSDTLSIIGAVAATLGVAALALRWRRVDSAARKLAWSALLLGLACPAGWLYAMLWARFAAEPYDVVYLHVRWEVLGVELMSWTAIVAGVVVLRRRRV